MKLVSGRTIDLPLARHVRADGQWPFGEALACGFSLGEAEFAHFVGP